MAKGFESEQTGQNGQDTDSDLKQGKVENNSQNSNNDGTNSDTGIDHGSINNTVTQGLSYSNRGNDETVTHTSTDTQASIQERGWLKCVKPTWITIIGVLIVSIIIAIAVMVDVSNQGKQTVIEIPTNTTILFQNNTSIPLQVKGGDSQIVLEIAEKVINEFNSLHIFYPLVKVIIDRVSSKWIIKATAEPHKMAKIYEKDWKAETIYTILNPGDIFCVRLTVLEDSLNAEFSIGKESFILKLPSETFLFNNNLTEWHPGTLYLRIEADVNTIPYNVYNNKYLDCWD